MIVETHARLPMSPSGEGLLLERRAILRRHRTGRGDESRQLQICNTPGPKATATSPTNMRLSPLQVIPATVSEAPYILDGLRLMTDAGRRIRPTFPTPADLPITSSATGRP